MRLLTRQQSLEPMVTCQHSGYNVVVADPRWLDEREAQVWRAFLDLQRDVEGVVERGLTAVGLSTSEYALLAPLSEAPEEGLRPGALGRQVGWDRSRISHQLRRLEQRGLVVRVECPSDRRGTVVQMTAAGRKAVRGAAPTHVASVRRHFIDLLTPEQGEVLVAVARRVRAGVRPDEHDPPDGACDTSAVPTGGV
jgi:DNA-binding MarR family transcriptional regulator